MTAPITNDEAAMAPHRIASVTASTVPACMHFPAIVRPVLAVAFAGARYGGRRADRRDAQWGREDDGHVLIVARCGAAV